MTINQILENEKTLTKRVMDTRNKVNEWIEELDAKVNGNRSLNEIHNAMVYLDCAVREYEHALGARKEFMEKEFVEKETYFRRKIELDFNTD